MVGRMQMNHDAELSDRQKDILQVIINTHITTAEAVGSRTVARKMSLKLSPASVRNVMADLEEMGYVSQPHTSAGRVPTENGYRFYVNQLMQMQEIDREQQQWIDGIYRADVSKIEEVLELSSRLLAIVSQYTAMVQTPAIGTETIKHIDVVPLSSGKAVVVMVTSTGEVKKRLAVLPEGTTDADTRQLGEFLNGRLCSLTCAEARLVLQSLHDDNSPLQDKMVTLARAIMQETLDDEEPRGVFLDGMENIFEEPEFRDVERLRPILRIFDEKRHLNEWIEYCMPSDEETMVSIRIGSENPLDGVSGCSIIVSPYRVSGQVRGAVGVIGPTRMRYSRTSSLVAYIASRLGRVLTDVCGGP